MAISFSASPSGLSLSPFPSSGRTTNTSAYGNAVNLGNIYKSTRANAFDPSGFIAQDTASSALEKSSAMQADANAYATSFGAINVVNQAKKRAKEAEDAAKKQRRKGMFGAGLGAVLGVGGTLLGGPAVGMIASKGGQVLGNAIG